ncbi:MAG: class F sortase [Caldilineaceae bacterium]
MKLISTVRQRAFGLALLSTLFVLLLAGCQPVPIPEAATSTPPPPTPTAAATSVSAQSAATATPSPGVERTDALAPEDTAPPSRLSIPAIGMDVPVVPMSWRVADVAGKRTTVWVLPDDALGWHVNSVGAGAAGNLVISGHQLLGDALLAPLALGEVVVGQEIHITDTDGNVFVYQVSEVSEPIEISEDPAAEENLDAEMTAQSGTPRLTLITGWPDFSSTHRIFVTAEFVGAQP